ncbi:YidC/Oxa1 family membrane protein insertase [Streptomyces turgidiscabies]|uniref:Membrane protein insertase YidC n=1 Tax=Streptomyces turgidiscabies (strain Car8) TaxID=698760 RepID=L7FH88_STRT8|nr:MULTISPECIES: membrane protein insertase YidC [Streptomyces]ELP70682.1 membrane protein insertase, YidC/Oxa1 family [Streptomyces turgidiscabies Car8]MDX3496020.1 YidC/Oxa1 family membrane protein insertase [Streptomyces turgidiscabies]GAQ72491.1 membrane protein insertase YidC [Streptomyces turgidiscabies]
MSSFLSAFADLVGRLADLLQPLFHNSSAAVAIILFTAFVRLLVHPLSRAAARGQKARAALQPKVAELRKRHAKDPKKLQQAVMELHAEEKVSPLSGCFPSLFQLPAFFLLYHLFSNPEIGGRTNGLLTHTLFAAPLGDRWADALGGDGIFGAAGLVYLGLFVLVAAVATFNYRRMKLVMAANPMSVNTGGGEAVPGLASAAKFAPFMSFFTLFSVAVMPLAAALYMVTSTTWSAVERAVLYRWQLAPQTGAQTGALSGASTRPQSST